VRDQLRVLGELGLLGALMPEQISGGLGMALVDIIAALESIGYAAPAGPWPEVVALGAFLGRIESERAASISARLASGEALVSGDLLGGRLLPYVEHSDALVLRHHGRFVVLEPSDWTATPQPGLGANLAEVTCLADGDALAERALDGARAGWATELAGLVISAISCGIGKRLVESATEYAIQRRQFGVPIGSFQAVKHQLVDAHAAVELARPGIWAAAWSFDHDAADALWRSSAARVRADAALTKAARVALQVHGAIGYTDELPLAVWLKPAWTIGMRWGGVSRHRSRMTEVLFREGPRSPAVRAFGQSSPHLSSSFR
jgi:alkylation response protein AidB-like acyl-CoA dehydrogenase